MCVSFGQDTLPRFTVKNLGFDREGKPSVVISWVNKFDSLKQISVQTSHDSLRNYRTLISLTDPNARMNGFADKKAPHDHMFYRLFVVKGDGQYFFTLAQKPIFDTARTVTAIETAVAKNLDLKEKEKLAAKPGFVPSFYVYTNKDGYVYLNLPDAEKQKYHIRFYEEDNSMLFEVKNIKESGLTLDKTNFLHAGWFNFELYNDDKLIEKNKFYLAKEF
ncbi:MAG TPA: hypothetical protein VFL47_09420 [Flavisolibacter sp.]|nr:hypothetical protein [Flavisolibacter sp.]